jgi:putative FmdB family regulatory protein
MPTYEYVCLKCNKKFDVFQSITEEPLKVCPSNGCKGKLKRLISGGSGLLFKGNGFYITDYRSKAYKEASRKESSATGSNSGTTQNKSTTTTTTSATTSSCGGSCSAKN